MDTPAPRGLDSRTRVIALALGVPALLLFAGSLRVGWPHPAYLLMMIAVGSAFGLVARTWQLVVWIGLSVVARSIFYEDVPTFSWESAQHHSVLVLTALGPALYREWRARDRPASERQEPPPSPSLPTET